MNLHLTDHETAHKSSQILAWLAILFALVMAGCATAEQPNSVAIVNVNIAGSRFQVSAHGSNTLDAAGAHVLSGIDTNALEAVARGATAIK